jgi:aryl-alcohol dehydrogenase-like predicted oxidoreductase
MAGYEWLRDSVSHPGSNQKIEKLQSVANDLDCSLAQLAIAWCASNPHVSSVITGASRVEQVRENMGALGVLERLTPEVMERITSISP